MNIASVWNIVWQDTPFHWAIAIILVFGVGYEIFITGKYLFQNERQYKSPYKSPRFVTTLCTSIGVLGTFYGIQQGLQGLNLGDISNSQQLMTSSIELLGNMKTAFSTSLMGLGCGSLFTLVLFLTDFLRQLKRDRSRNNRTVNNQQPPSAEAIGKAVGRSIAEQFTALNQLTSEAIGEAVAQRMRSPLGHIYQEQRRIRELQENQGQRVLEQLIQDLRVEVIEPVAQKLDESAELTRQASEAVTNLHKELGGISKSLASSVETIQDFQKDTLAELKDFAKELKQTLNDFQTDTKDVLKQTGEEINKAVEQSIEGMTAQREAFKESANQAAVTFRGIRGELEAALKERAEVEQQMLQGLRSGIVQILNRTTTVFEQQNSTLQTVGNEASGLMNSAKDNLLATLNNINHSLLATSKTVENELEKFRREYQTNLNNFFEQQNNLLEGTLGEQRDGLAEVVTNLNTVFEDEYNRRRELAEETNQTMTTLRNAIKETGNFANAIGLNSSQRLTQLQELARQIGTQTQDVQTQYGQLSNTFQESLTAWTNHFSQLQETFFNQADSSMANVCSSLLQTANVLVAANDNRNNGNGRNHHE
ncbi:MAG: hypothetical protein WBA41_33065 [Rivularia sp. (in: cyanobacteria)]